jgi:hypothetical protein
MRVLGAFSHGVIDYLMVIFLAIGPSVVGFTNHRLAMICYGLAVVHFLLTIITRFPLGVLKTLPFWLHGSIEIVVAVLLVILPWLAHFSAGVLSRNFFIAIGVLIGVIFLLTDYRSAGRAGAASTPTP